MGSGNDEARTYPLRVPQWRGIPGLVHGFLGRHHGLAPGPFTSHLLRARLAAAGEEATAVVAARQVHGARVLVAGKDMPAADGEGDDALSSTLPEADALVTTEAVILTIRTADCVPILLVAPGARVVAAVHAGWRGMLAGVIDATLETLAERYTARAHDLRAAVGPAIGACCYEFGAEDFGRLVARIGAAAEAAWFPGARPDQTKGRLDLRRLARVILEGAGVARERINVLGTCTAEHPAELHSYRRDGANAGRQLSYIGWRR